MPGVRGPLTVRCYLTVSASGAVRVTKNKPAIGYDEIPIELNLEVPRAYFERPSLAATLVVPADSPLPTAIPVVVQGNVQRAIEESTGLAVKLTVVGPADGAV